MKEMVISTSRVNSYGSRVITEGIDLSQYVRNPILLWMHCRQYPGERAPLPIGRVENLRTEGDALIGTPVFDSADEFARQIESKWENGFLKMCSAGIEIELNSILVEKWKGKAHRLVIQRQKRMDGELDLWEGEYTARWIRTNDYEASEKESVV